VLDNGILIESCSDYFGNIRDFNLVIERTLGFDTYQRAHLAKAVAAARFYPGELFPGRPKLRAADITTGAGQGHRGTDQPAVWKRR